MIVWSIVFAVCLVVEIAIPALVFIWFALGALVVAVLSGFIKDPIMQTVIFSVVSLASLLLLRGYCKRFVKAKESLPKESVIILNSKEDNDGQYIYDVRYKGSVWTAFSNEKFNIDDKATIKSFEGNKIRLVK